MADRAGDYIAGLFGAEDELLASLARGGRSNWTAADRHLGR